MPFIHALRNNRLGAGDEGASDRSTAKVLEAPAVRGATALPGSNHAPGQMRNRPPTNRGNQSAVVFYNKNQKYHNIKRVKLLTIISNVRK